MGIRLENISHKNKLKNITYNFNHEKITSIIGPSGSGKTMLLASIMGILKIDDGNIFNDQKISFVFQHPNEYFLNTKVIDEIKAFGDEIIAKEYLSFLDLELSFLEKDINHLSKSEQFKLAFLIALSSNNPYLILDEPTTALDDKSKKQLVKLLLKLNKEKKSTIIVTSNDINFVYEISDDIVLLVNGKIKLQIPKNQIIDNYLILKKNGMEIPKILEFIYIAKHKKKKDLQLTYDIKELMKDIYRNV